MAVTSSVKLSLLGLLLVVFLAELGEKGAIVEATRVGLPQKVIITSTAVADQMMNEYYQNNNGVVEAIGVLDDEREYRQGGLKCLTILTPCAGTSGGNCCAPLTCVGVTVFGFTTGICSVPIRNI